MDYAKMLALLLAAHALCDYPLQGDFLAKAKNPAQPIPGVPWWCAMAAHCAIHAGAVLLVTSSMVAACFEFALHWMVDIEKCWGRISFATDQASHVACKVAYVVILALTASGGGAQ